MIFKDLSASEKRKKLRENLEKSCLRFVGSFSPLVSRLIEQKGFDGIYISGAVVSSLKAFPDIGLTTLTELGQQAEELIKASSLPAIVDADTGFGGYANVARSVYELEKRGLSGLHLEDQDFPKRCGHLDQKNLISIEEMILKIKTAVKARKDKNFLIIARTDSRAVEGLEQAVERAKNYVKAGADVIFPEALKSVEEFKFFRSELSIPLMANMTEFGKTDIIKHETFKKLKYNMMIYPVSAWRLALKAVEQGLDQLAQDQQEKLLDKMQSREDLYKLLQYEDYKVFDKELYNFNLKK